LDWITPVAGESLSKYALRLSEPIDTTKPFCLVGLSSGGMMATEIAKKFAPQQVILLSSASTYMELPVFYRMLGQVGIHKLVPIKLLKWITPFTYWLFGAKATEEKRLLKAIIKDTDPKFLEWAINAVLGWRNDFRPPNLFHIHGGSDRIIPCKGVKYDKVVRRAGHLMVFSHAEQVTKLMQERPGYS
jgi:hypothetical protein